MEILNYIPEGLLEFGMVLVFSLLIGLEQRRIHAEEKALFGTDRTFTFIGILGYMLYILDPDRLLLFGIGGLGLFIIFGIFYYKKIKQFKDFGITSITVALITYSLAPMIFTQPKWLVLLIVVTVLIFAELKPSLLQFSSKFDKGEFITLGKFLVITGVVLPIVRETNVVLFLGITPYQVWLAVVIISTISYLSYLLQKFVFKESGILVSGILGGLYSSTATTFILAKKSKDRKRGGNIFAASIILATAMMFIRIMVLMFIFNFLLFKQLAPFFIILFVISAATGIGIYYFFRGPKDVTVPDRIEEDNPLELKVAAIFTLLFVVFTVITHFTIEEFGITGLNILSFLVGFTHIDPFLINIFEGKYTLSNNVIAFATMQAMISNHILKGIYTSFLASKETRKYTLMGLAIVLIANIIIAIIIY